MVKKINGNYARRATQASRIYVDSAKSLVILLVKTYLSILFSCFVARDEVFNIVRCHLNDKRKE